MKKMTNVALLGADTVFEGKLSFHGTVRIDGHFKGDISSDGTLVIGEQGIIEADISARYVVISGEVHGNINAGLSIEVFAKGKIYGNIVTPSLIVHEGVIFEGNCKMDRTMRPVVKELPDPAQVKKGLIKFFPSGKNKDEAVTIPFDHEKEEQRGMEEQIRYS